MKRRQVLVLVGGVAAAGCSQDPIDTTTTPSPTSPSPSGAGRPEIDKIALLSDWEEFGDVYENQVQSVPPTENPVIGVRFESVCNSENELRWRLVVIARNADGDAVASRTSNNEEFSNACSGAGSTVQWEQAISLLYDNEFGTEWPPGDYEAQVRLDDYYSERTVSQTILFSVDTAGE